MQAIGYYNGTMGPLDTLQVPASDRALYFGDGCYEAVMVVNGIPFAFDLHLDRFYSSLSLLSIAPPMDRAQLRRTLLRVVAATEAREVLLYWQCSRGAAPRNHVFPDASVAPTLLITAQPKPIEPPRRDLKLLTTEDVRFSLCHIKTLNLLPNVLAAERAKCHGCDEAVLVRDGFVTEGSHTNIHVLSGGTLYTHPLDHHILPGVTRKRLLALCEELGIPVSEQAFPADRLSSCDAILVTSSSLHVAIADTLNGKRISGPEYPLAVRLAERYFAAFLEETDRGL